MIELTPGAQWAIGELERLDAREEYHRLRDLDGEPRAAGISHVIYSLRNGDPLSLVLTYRTAEPPERWAILHAALVRDAMAQFEARIAELESRNASMRTEIDGLQRDIGMLCRTVNDLDERTFGTAQIGGM